MISATDTSESEKNNHSEIEKKRKRNWFTVFDSIPKCICNVNRRLLETGFNIRIAHPITYIYLPLNFRSAQISSFAPSSKWTASASPLLSFFFILSEQSALTQSSRSWGCLTLKIKYELILSHVTQATPIRVQKISKSMAVPRKQSL